MRRFVAAFMVLFLTLISQVAVLRAQQPSLPGGGGGEQPLCPGCGDQDPPIIWLNAPPGSVSVPNPYIEVYWCDGFSLNAASRWIKVNGVDVTSSFGYTLGGDDCVARAYSGTTSVSLNVGSNSLEAHICDNDGFCTTTTFYINRVSGGGPPTVALRNQNGQNIDRGLCLTLGAGQSAGLSCGDLFVAHGMPAYRTMGRDRSLSLFYSSAMAAPRPVVAAAVSLPAGFEVPNSVFAELKINGVARASANYYAFSSGPTVQIALAYDASGDASGIYPFTLEIRNVYSGSNHSTTVSGELLVINRSASEFGGGWWLAGVEQLVLGQSSNRILWLGGDGSAAVYDSVSAGRWARAAGAYRDTLVYTPGWKQNPAKYTRTLRHGVQVVYDVAGRHKNTITRTGATTTFSWTGSPVRLTSVQVPPTGAGGTTYTVAWEAGTNLLDRITDPAGRVLDATITSGNVVQLADPDNVAVQFVYDGSRRLTRRISRGGYGTWYSYANGLHVTRSAVPLAPPDSARTTFQWWDERGLAVGIVGGTFNAYDTIGVNTVVDGPRTDVLDVATFWVDRWGAPTRIQDPLGNITTITRTNPLFPALVTRLNTPSGAVLGAGYNSRGNLAWMADSTFEGSRNGFQVATTSWVYSDAGFPDSPTEVRTPVDTSRYRYVPGLGLPDTLTAQGGARTVFSYVTSGPLRGLVTSVKNVGVRVVDPGTWVRSLQDLTTTFVYDALGNDSVTTTPSGSQTRLERDVYTRTIRTYDEASHRIDYGYDLLNRMTSRTVYDPDPTVGFMDRFFYSATGQIDSVWDPRRVPRRWSYDAADRPVSMTDPTGTTEVRYVNPAGMLDSVRTRSLRMIRFRYDAAGRLLATRYPAAVNTFGIPGHDATIPGDSIVRSYDAAGRMLQAFRGADTITNTWNREGTLRSQRQRIAGGGTVSMEYWNDLGGRRTKFFNGTDTLRYSYGSNALLSTLAVEWMTGQSPDTFRFWFDALGRRDSVVYAGPTVHVSFGHDVDGQLRMICSRHLGNVNSNDYLEHTWHLSSVTVDGLARSWTQSAGGERGPGSSCSGSLINTVDQALLWQYDQRHQLRSDGSHSAIGYDSSGNRVSRRWTNGTLRDSLLIRVASNQLDVAYGDGNGGIPFQRGFNYDADGSLTLEFRPPGVFDDTRLYYYNALGEMTGHKVYKWTGSAFQWLGMPTMCHYDPLGRRIESCGGGGGWLHFDGDNVARSTAWRFVHGPALDDPLVGMYQSGGQYLKHYYLTDGAGRHLAFTDATGTSSGLTELTYSQNGGNQAGSIRASRTFENGRAESANAPLLSYYRNRYYDQQTGRWTQEDPIGLAGGLNLYAYVGNNPAGYTDPFGLSPECDNLKQSIRNLAQSLRGRIEKFVKEPFERFGRRRGRPGRAPFNHDVSITQEQTGLRDMINDYRDRNGPCKDDDDDDFDQFLEEQVAPDLNFVAVPKLIEFPEGYSLTPRSLEEALGSIRPPSPAAVAGTVGVSIILMLLLPPYPIP